MPFGTFRARASYGIAKITNPTEALAFINALDDQTVNLLHFQTARASLQAAEASEDLTEHASDSFHHALETEKLLIDWAE